MEFTIANISIIVATLFGSGSLIALIFEKRKNKAITSGLETDNEAKIIKIYVAALDDLGVRYEKKFIEIVEMYERKVKVLEDEIKLHKRINNNLKRENLDLRRQLDNKE
ncbi:MAG: hypothetical protein COS42_04570 [Flavobacteriales bacterium CG03_land_8_20_14_0_80_35_15]|nr:hypothetical protein [Flavobacteriia bacterium]PIV17480.1 MAG: hypothetical protein COS42_04570 [Flavobacteriales bacterium CG03_land_8_20_14_0_80_35_15]